MINDILLFTAGLFIFLFALAKLGEQVQRFFTARIRDYIRYAVKKPHYGLLTGAATTILFQSSSAVTAITIGMVSAGLISFYRSLAIILGADIGTTLTVQFVVWKVTDFSPVLIMIGGMLWFSAKGKWRTVGEAIFFFGLVFFGLSLMSVATAPMKQHPAVIRFFKDTQHPLIGIALGAIFTGIVHASLIPISLLVILAQQGLISIDNALPIVFGANIGTTVTALMAAAIANVSGKRSAVSHVVFKLTGVVLCMAFLPTFVQIVRGFSESPAQQIVFGHFLFNALIVVIFIAVLKPFARLIEKIIPGREEVLPLWPEFLSEKDLSEPETALANVHRELEREIQLTQTMFDAFIKMGETFSEGARRNIIYMEMVVDNLSKEIIKYLWQASSMEFTTAQSNRLFTYTAMVDDVERVGDQIIRLVSLARDKHRRRIAFSGYGMKELETIERAVARNLKDAVMLINRRDEKLIRDIFRREDEIDCLVKRARESHLVRFHRRICPAEAGPIFVEMLIHLERISDHCQNIAEYIDDIEKDKAITNALTDSRKA